MTYRSRKGRPGFSLVLLFLGLAGCANLFDTGAQPPCPQVVTLADAQAVAVHRPGPGRDLTDVLVDGLIAGVAASCDYDDEGRIDATIIIDFDFSIGPATEDNTGQWQYFILVTTPDRKIVVKRVFMVDLKFEKAVFRTRLQEEMGAVFAYAPWPDASGFKIFVGFQLTRDQLDYVRSLKR